MSDPLAHAVPDRRPDERGGSPGRRGRHLRVVAVEGPERRRRLLRFAAVGGSGLAVAVVFGSVGMHVVLAQNQFRLDHVKARADQAQSQYERLRLQVDQLESPQRIVATAEGKLGMVAPNSVTYLTPSAAVSASTSDPSPSRSTQAPNNRNITDWAQVKPQLVARP
jgi:cell division protein FtsL